MDPLDLFNPTKKMGKINLYRGARKELSVDSLSRSISIASLADTYATGTDYAEEYIKKADRELFEASKYLRGTNHKLDNVSLATDAQAPQSFMEEEQEKIYRTYNKVYQPNSNLTIKTVHSDIIDSITTEPVTIIQGPTGCGKTTQVPQIIWDYYHKKKLFCNIIVTQPRRIAAISIAGRVATELKCPLGSLVGYKVGLSSRTSSDTRITYCTTGVLLQKLILAKNLNEFSHIIIDEIHERDQDMDFLLLVLRKLLYLNSHNVKIILMSATFQVDKFAKYFASYVGQSLTPARVIDVTKRNFYNVNEYYLCELLTLGKLPSVEPKEPNISSEMIDFARRLIVVMDNIDMSADDSEQNDARPSILVFLPGIHEIEEMHNALSDQKNEPLKWDIVVLHSSITNDEQQQIFRPTPEGYRRIILSTNIAESSLTVPDVKYVIDFCLTKLLTYDPVTNYQTLELTWASKANCQQRAGRTGRVMDGRVYRLIPKSMYRDLPEENPPEIVKAPLANVVLRTKLLDMGSPQALLALALDPPDLSNLERTILTLKEAGGLLHNSEDRFDGEITDLGRVMAALPMDIHISKMIVLGHVFSVLTESVIIGASMAVKNMFSTPFKHKLDAYNTKLLWAQNNFSDGLAFLHAYNVWKREKSSSRIKNDAQEKNWARMKCLQIRVLREIEALIQETNGRLNLLGINETVGSNKIVYEEKEKSFILKVVFAGAFYPQYFVTKSTTDEITKIKMLGGLDPLNTVYLQGWPTQQPGILYARRFQKLFDKCADQEKIQVKFDNTSRVYIQFERDNNGKGLSDNPGVPSRSVYRALKLRKVQKKMAIPVMSVDAAMQRAEKLKLNTKISTHLLRSIEEKIENLSVKTIAPNLPGLDVTKIPLKLTYYVDPGYFWARVDNKETTDYEIKIKNCIQYMEFEKFDKSPEVGALVLAPMTMNDKTDFHRAVIKSISITDKKNILVQVFFVDYGMVKEIQLCDLRRLPKNNVLTEIPALAFECVLALIKPYVQNTSSAVWTPEAKKLFKHIIDTEATELYGYVYSVVNSIVRLTLFCATEYDKKININELLVDKEFAIPKEEDYLSKYNHELRKNVYQFSEDEKRYHEYRQFYSIESYPEAPDDNECSHSVFLNGPHSPLEVHIVNLTNTSLGRKVTIAEESVNSIILESNLVDPSDTLVVAGSVSQGAISKNLHLRNTTLMPGIPGLIPLIALIFAPQIELRRIGFFFFLLL
ncbi:LOW QUALITY PROTEIN: probable ATP-dependent RNA helicase spindle-E [Chelonus insularis]|uniref:LOW QUALITY PROTEIN: probable ATP-dependent RNA helicase spindle-E n=1 Tax=Chelonus insularis TaxID=460826 RepID=UPI00158D8953|nr:LOW QUALITY PROTEIN: probable ATP-dependent RNA helicase spindle-E [Chelonus insularis]